MATTIKLKNGSGVPAASSLVQGEPAIDLTNRRLYTENASGSVIEVGNNPSVLSIAGTTVTSTAAELNILDGVTATASELNILDGVTSSTTELNILDGVTATASELNILDGVTSSTAELNILDGVTATAAELNVLDGVTSFLDEDDMASDSATSIPSQQSVKAYVQSQLGTGGGSVSFSTLDVTTNLQVPDGTTTNRPGSPSVGNFRYNTTTGGFEGYSADGWGEIGGSGANLTTNNFTGDNSNTAFTLSIDPSVEQNTFVYIDGVYQQKNTYSTSGTTLTFSTAPPTGASIEVMSMTATNSIVGTVSDNAITTAKIADLNVTTAKIANSNVTTAKIADDNITSDKLAHTLDIVTSLGIGGGSSNGVSISQGAIALKNGGAQSKIDFYCESSNAHYTRLQAAPHSSYAGNIVLTLPASDGDANQVLTSDGSGTLSFQTGKLVGKETIYIPAAAMYPNTTNGCADLEQVELSNGPELKCLDFDPSSDENAQFTVCFPKSWNEGTVTFQAFWTVTGTNTGTVAWGLSGVSIADDASINTAFGTNVVATAKAFSGTSNDIMVSAESGAVTIANAAVDTQTYFQIMRDVSADTQSGDARLLGIKLFFTTDAANDS